MREKIIIIKIGATGDVVRTTTLLHLYPNANITWITAKKNIAILPFKRPSLKRIVAIEDIETSGILEEYFDFLISLDDDVACASLASKLKAKKIFGSYIQDKKVVYTPDAYEWFDMGLSSRFGKEKADQLKWENKYSFQEILFRMLGKEFNGEEYLIPEDIVSQGKSNVIGIESRAGNRWPTKVWNQYVQLADYLRSIGYTIVFFEERDNIKDYLQDIGNVSLVICGDTLAMHIAIALKIPCVTFFTCTSPVEIYGYNRMEKLVSPYLKDAFYKTDYLPQAVSSIHLEEVLLAIKKLNLRENINK